MTTPELHKTLAMYPIEAEVREEALLVQSGTPPETAERFVAWKRRKLFDNHCRNSK